MCTGFPDLTLFYMSIYGGFGYDYCAAGLAFQGLAAGIPQTGNPPYTVNDFLAMYPKFYGPGTDVAGTLSSGSPTITGVSSTTGILAGQLVTGTGIPVGTVVSSTSSTTVTLSQNATATGRFNCADLRSRTGASGRDPGLSESGLRLTHAVALAGNVARGDGLVYRPLPDALRAVGGISQFNTWANRSKWARAGNLGF